MLADAIQKIATLATKANGIEVVEHKATGETFIRRGNDFETLDRPALDRNGSLHGLDDLIVAALDGTMVTNPEVFHDNNEIVLILDRSDGHERMTMPLTQTNRFEKLINMQGGVNSQIAPRNLIRMLRFELSDTGIDHVIAGLRKLDFTRKSDGRSDIEHGKESLGKSVEAAVQQADNIPEEFDIEVPIYSNAGLRDLSTVRIKMGIYIDVFEQMIELSPLADEMEKALVTAQRAIGEYLRSKLQAVPVFNGCAY